MPVLYDAVAAGMWAFTRSAFRVRSLGSDVLRLEAGTLIVSTHRRETDVPLVCPTLFYGGGLWRRRSRRMSYVAREDMFERGFVAGFAPGLPLRARRLLFPLTLAEGLRRVEVYPIRSANDVRLGEIAARLPDHPLAEYVPGRTLAALAERARAVGLAAPVAGRDALRGEYADLLWESFTRGGADSGALEAVWAARAVDATADFRRLVGLVRDGAILLVFPEGRLSPDGELGPIRPGIRALIRRGRPRQLVPVGLAYDPLTTGRTRAYVSIGKTAPPPSEGEDGDVLRLLRAAMPLTCGQVVAHRLDAGLSSRRELERELAAEVEATLAEDRNVDPALLSARGRRRRVADALAAAPRRARELAYLAREYESIRGTTSSAPRAARASRRRRRSAGRPAGRGAPRGASRAAPSGRAS